MSARATGEVGKERKKERKMNRNFYIMASGFAIFLLVFSLSIIDSSVEMFTTVASRSCSVPLVGGRLMMMMMMESLRSHRTILQKSGEANGIAKGVPIHTLTLFLFVVSFRQILVCIIHVCPHGGSGLLGGCVGGQLTISDDEPNS